MTTEQYVLDYHERAASDWDLHYARRRWHAEHFIRLTNRRGSVK